MADILIPRNFKPVSGQQQKNFKSTDFFYITFTSSPTSVNWYSSINCDSAMQLSENNTNPLKQNQDLLLYSQHFRLTD